MRGYSQHRAHRNERCQKQPALHSFSAAGSVSVGDGFAYGSSRATRGMKKSNPSVIGGMNTVTPIARLVRRQRDSSLKLGMTVSACHVERSRDISAWVEQLWRPSIM